MWGHIVQNNYYLYQLIWAACLKIFRKWIHESFLGVFEFRNWSYY
jgi:hypothetical protein